MSDQDEINETSPLSQAVLISDAEERLIYAYISGNQKDVAAAKDNLFDIRSLSNGQPSPEVVERLIKNDPTNAARAGLVLPESK